MDEKLLSIITELISFNIDQPIACVWIESPPASKSRNKKLILLTDACCYCLAPYMFGKLRIASHYYWFHIKNVLTTDETSFQLIFKEGEVLIYHKDAKMLLDTIFNHLHTIETQVELNELKIDFSSYNISVSPNFMTRFCALSFSLERSPPDPVIAFIDRIVELSLHEIDLVFFKNFPDFIEPFFRSLVFAPFIKSLVVPKCDIDGIWTHLTGLFRSNATVQHLTINQQLSNKFHSFCSCLCSNQALALKSLNFIDVEFTPEYIDFLSTIIVARDITILSIENSLDLLSQNRLYKHIQLMHQFEKLRVLNLNNTKGINLDGFFNSCFNISTVYLENCEIEISDFFKRLASTKSTFQLVSLNGNQCNDNIEELNIPDTLQSLFLSNISWSSGNFAKVFKFFVQKSHFQLIIANTELDDWNSFFKSLNRIDLPCIMSLSWENNPLHSLFMIFLRKCNSLKYLNISGCFSFNDDFINQFCPFIKQTSSLQNLKMRGTAEKHLALQTSHFFEALLLNKSIEIIDISYQKILAIGLLEFAKVLVQNWTIQSIEFDGSDVDSPSIYFSFISLLRQRGAPLDIVWPNHDFFTMISKNLMSQEQMQTIQSNFQSLFAGNPQAEAPDREYPHSVFDSSIGTFDEIFDNSDFQMSECDDEVEFMKAEVIDQNYEEEDEFELGVPSIPPIDNEEIEKSLKERFSSKSILARIH